jgi:hypothetical protein
MSIWSLDLEFASSGKASIRSTCEREWNQMCGCAETALVGLKADIEILGIQLSLDELSNSQSITFFLNSI